MTSLTQQKCVPCEGGTKPLTRNEFQQYLDAVPGWTVVNEERAIKKELRFKDFAQTLAFVNKTGALAEAEGHHPDLNLHSWNKLTITLSTHAIGGLSINDFILAAKIDQLTRQ
jgi:4a-hydroxytetrahydrobiopterin dehydratase